jgi:hypothetical protein
VDVALKLATSTQTIEVSRESGPVINTENGTIGDTKDFQQITNLPVNYRGATTSPLAMLATVPGAQQMRTAMSPSAADFPRRSNTPSTDPRGSNDMNPSSELISEFKVAQFNNNAEFAQLGDVTISTKSGGDQFHGSAFEYLQNSAFDAEVWNSGDKPHKAYNTFGDSLGGPLQVPMLSRGKPKTFFIAHECYIVVFWHTQSAENSGNRTGHFGLRFEF